MSRPNPPAPDPWRKARFREEARDIVAKDRYDRKYGRAVDTVGAIARALERAYKLTGPCGCAEWAGRQCS